jgi:5-methyltetrahydropteroyltriglutamate--homocysteine methyltransferase
VIAQLDDKQILVGCIDLSDMTVETPEVVAARVSPITAIRSINNLRPSTVNLAFL